MSIQTTLNGELIIPHDGEERIIPIVQQTLNCFDSSGDT
jgi:hypothetical protein